VAYAVAQATSERAVAATAEDRRLGSAVAWPEVSAGKARPARSWCAGGGVRRWQESGGEKVRVAARGWAHAVCFVVAMINSPIVGCGQRVVWAATLTARAFFRVR
jgi:hypothetical protein